MKREVSFTRVRTSDEGGFSPVVASIFDTLLDAIHEGRIQPGERISDSGLATQFQVSRTPVREAIQRLRELGLVEAMPGQFTRVVEVTPQQTAQATVVWVALYSALVEEVAGRVPDAVYEAMVRDHDAYLEALPTREFRRIAGHNFSFYKHLMALSNNPILLSGIRRVVHLIRLGSLDLPEAIEVSVLGDAQTQLLAGIRSARPDEARHAIELILDIDVPLE